jgi:uncharacterized phage infection (PIP) family protein YhgE
VAVWGIRDRGGGITSTSLIAVLGALGLLVSMFVFVILGLPSAGATVPLQAAPPLFGWLAKFEPMQPRRRRTPGSRVRSPSGS